jgi:phosphodiesterase/alkaline phosphatase D-like protein
VFSPAKLLLYVALTSAAFGQAQFMSGVWCGNVTPTTATVVVRLDAPGQRVRLQVGVNGSLSPAIFSAAANTAAGAGNTVKLTVQGLTPNTDYYYGVEVAGVLRTEPISRGRFHTFPLGRASFKIAFGSCGDFRAPNQRAYEAIVNEQPLLFINLGDLHYSDTNTTDAEQYRRNYDQVLRHQQQSALYRAVPVAYMWDDHDYCGNDSDTTAIGRDTARSVYKERVPHYPISAAGGTVAQAFTIGRVRFIMTDLRSASVSPAQKESASKTRLGTGQKAWFKQELINARDSGFPAIVWVCPDPWIAPAKLGDDTWGGHATERTEIANFIRDNGITNLTLLSGDMHALAFDDGTHSDYATGGGARVTVLHGAALTSEGSSKGGPYLEGPMPGNEQYGILEVFDNGGPSIACRFSGMKVGEERKISRIFSSSVAGAKNHALVNISTLSRLRVGNDTLVTGFVLSAAPDTAVIVRAVGPTLGAFGINDALPAPILSVFQGDQLIATNAGWADPAGAGVDTLNAAFDSVGAFRLGDPTSADCALLLRLAPGAYTVQVKDAGGAGGSALVEVYDVP